MAAEQSEAARMVERPARPALQYPPSFLAAHNFPVLPTLPNRLAFPTPASESNASRSNSLALPTASRSNPPALPTPASGSNASGSNSLALPAPVSQSNSPAWSVAASGSNPLALPVPAASNPLAFQTPASTSNPLASSAPAPRPNPVGVRPAASRSKPSGVSKRRHPPRRMVMNPAVLPPVEEGQSEESNDVWSSAPNCTKWEHSKARTYNEETLGQFLVASQNPEVWKLMKAAEIIHDHLSGLNFRFAFMGGFSLYIRGSTRVPKDLDITVPQPSVDKAIGVLRRCANVCIPDPIVMGFRTTVFINCLPWMYPPPLVKMDLIISGSLSMPSNMQLFSERVMPRHGWYSKFRLPSVVAVESMVHAKLHSHYDRRKYTSTDFNDLLWLIQHCAEEVHDGKALYYVKHYEFFAPTAYAYSETWGNRAADVLGFDRAKWTKDFVAQVDEARALLQLENAVMF